MSAATATAAPAAAPGLRAAPTAAPAAGGPGLLSDAVLLTKPRVALLALAAVAVGVVGASAVAGVAPGAPLFTAALLGGALVAAGASVWNQVLERVADGRMDRTRRRPLPQGRLGAPAAGLAGTGLLLAGLAVLWIWTTPAAVLAGAATWALYVWGYTPLKQVTPLNTQVGAVAGALPPVLGWVAVTGDAGTGAWALFLIVFLWQLPHVLALGAMYADDYRAAGIRLLSIDDADGVAGRQAVAAALGLVPAACAPFVLGFAGPVYGAAAFGLSAWYVAAAVRWTVRGGAGAGPAEARRLFRVSLVYLPLLFAVLVADQLGYGAAWAAWGGAA